VARSLRGRRPCKQVTSVSNGLVGAASGGAARDMDPEGQRRIGDAAGGANNILISFRSISGSF
jgi:hypothetical protein